MQCLEAILSVDAIETFAINEIEIEMLLTAHRQKHQISERFFSAMQIHSTPAFDLSTAK